jgi:hypothetical protein
MKIFQIIFRGGRVQNLMADQYSRQNGAVQFRTGRSTVEFPEVDLIKVDELADEGAGQTFSTERPLGFAAAYG